MQSYHHRELSLLPQSDLIKHMKLNNAAESQTEANICFYQEIFRFYYTLFFQLFYQYWIIKRLAYNLSKTALILFCVLV